MCPLPNAHWGPVVYYPALWPPPSQAATAYYLPMKCTLMNTILPPGITVTRPQIKLSLSVTPPQFVWLQG